MNKETLLTLAWRIVDRLKEAGYEAYLVGGYVRDKLLGRPIKDIDIATSALPEHVISLFDRALPTGLQHGTVTVIVDGNAYEVTTYRRDEGYHDHRRPDRVQFVERIEEDLARRDFTMNAMALDRDETLIDPYGGRSDLEQGIIRCVGEASRRFDEDALRMLRCIRFASEYDLSIDPDSWQALVAGAELIRYVAIERVRAEFERIVEGMNPGRGLILLYESGIYHHFKSGMELQIDQLAERCPEAVHRLAALEPAYLRWSVLCQLSHLDADQAAVWMRRWTFPGVKIRSVRQVIALIDHMALYEPTADLERYWKLAVLRVGEDVSRDWLKIVGLLSEVGHIEPLRCQVVLSLLEHGEHWTGQMPIHALGELSISGDDLIAAGWRPGPAVGRILARLAEAVALGEADNDPGHLLSMVESKAWLIKE